MDRPENERSSPDKPAQPASQVANGPSFAADSTQLEAVVIESPPRGDEPPPIGKKPFGRSALNILDRSVNQMAKILFYIGLVLLMAMLLVIVGDVIGIKIFSRPVPGGIEYVSFLSVMVISFTVAYTQVKGGHVAVDFIIEKFPRRIKLLINILTALLSVGVVAILAIYSFKFGTKLRVAGEVSMTREIPFYPFVYAMAFCFVITLIVLVRDFVKSIAKAAMQWSR